ncbi:MAG: BlaI/MecI/CopY family transcriptional regulator [Candidatus Zixiibacteriota bacterium]|nr:MAG: BlaI/MecI/CopY family transcriptional regulator [candidate division Zixibacteria bacterium]
MARKRTATLTEAELRLMTVIWRKGEATVSEVADALPGDLNLAYNTVLTTMRILEKKGYLERARKGRAHVYKPVVSQDQARLKAVRHVVKSFFDDSPELLLLSMMEDEKLSPEEVERLKKMVDERSTG